MTNNWGIEFNNGTGSRGIWYKYFVNIMVDCQYSQDSTFEVVVSSMEKYAWFGHLEEEYEMMGSV